MRKITVIFIVLVFACSFLAACQPTPEEPVVINKNENVLEDAIAAPPQPEIENIDGVSQDGMTVEEHWTESFERNGITVNVDADILMPNASKIPVYKVDALRIDEEFVKEKVQILIENGYEVTNGTTFESFAPLTKKDIMGKIIFLKREIEKLKQGIGDPVDLDVPIEEQLKTAEDLLEKWEKEYNSPNYNGGIEPLPLIYDPIVFSEVGFGGPTYTAVDAAGNEYILCFTVDISTGGFPQEQMYFAKDIKDADDEEQVKEKYELAGAVSVEEAQKTAKDFLEMMGMGEDYVYYSEEEPGKSNYMTYTHNYSGIPENQEVTCSGPSVTESEQYTEYLYRENMHFMVDQNGIASFSWAWPYKIIETENRNVSIKPLEEIKEIFRDQIFYNTAVVDFEDTKQINIDKIRLGYCLKYIKNERKYRMVPVWDFVGAAESEDASQYVTAGSFVTLNAIDGSNINRNDGY